MLGKINFQEIGIQVAGAGAGVIAAEYVNNKLLGSLDPKYAPFVLIGVGVFLPQAMPKNEILKAVGAGMMGKGVEKALQQYAPEVYAQIAAPQVMVGYNDGVLLNSDSRAFHTIGEPVVINPDEILIDDDGTQYSLDNNGNLVQISGTARENLTKDLSNEVI